MITRFGERQSGTGKPGSSPLPAAILGSCGGTGKPVPYGKPGGSPFSAAMLASCGGTGKPVPYDHSGSPLFPATSLAARREQACLFRLFHDLMEGCILMALPVRKLQRMRGFDYSTPTSYFITICTHEKKCIFGHPLHLNRYGMIAREHISRLPVHFSGLQIDHSVVMPNHVHILLTINWGDVPPGQPFPHVSAIIGSYKSGVSRDIHQTDHDLMVWQKSFYDHMPRTEKDFQEIWKYIDENPHNWDSDQYHSI